MIFVEIVFTIFFKTLTVEKQLKPFSGGIRQMLPIK